MTYEKRAQKFHSDDASLPRSGVISMAFLRSFLRRHLARKPVVASPNVGCVLRLVCSQLTLGWPFFLFPNALSIIVHMVRMQVLRGRREIAFGQIIASSCVVRLSLSCTKTTGLFIVFQELLNQLQTPLFLMTFHYMPSKLRTNRPYLLMLRCQNFLR